MLFYLSLRFFKKAKTGIMNPIDEDSKLSTKKEVANREQEKEFKQNKVLKAILFIVIGLVLVAVGFFAPRFTSIKYEQEPIAQVVLKEPEVIIPFEQIKLETYSKILEGPYVRYKQANQSSLDHTLAQVNNQFVVYASRIPDFVDQVTGLGARFTILKKLAQDTLSREDKENVSRYIDEIFRATVFTDEQLEADLNGILAQCDYELDYNRQELYLDSQKFMSIVPRIKPIDTSGFLANLNLRITRNPKEIAYKSLLNFVLIETGSEIATFAVRSLLLSLPALSTRIVGSSVAGVGASVVGIVPGPLDNIILAAAGFGVGLAVDIFASKQTEAKMIEEYQGLFAESAARIIKGDEFSPGLSATVAEYITTFEALDKEVLWDSIQENI